MREHISWSAIGPLSHRQQRLLTQIMWLHKEGGKEEVKRREGERERNVRGREGRKRRGLESEEE